MSNNKMDKEKILLDALNTFGNFTSVEQEFNDNQLEVIYEAMNQALNIADVSTRYSYLEIEEILKSQIDYMIQCVQDSEGTIDPSEDINDIEITLKVLKHVYNVC